MNKKTLPSSAGFGVVAIVIAVALIALVGFIGWKVWEANQGKKASNTNTSSQSTGNRNRATTQPTDPYAGWKTYTSTSDKLSFRYPADWQAVDTTGMVTQEGDSFKVTSPSGNLSVSWLASISGIGGACDNTIMPGTSVGSTALNPCPYWSVSDKEKLPGADLYYIAGVTTTDGVTYSPFCALQAPDGLLGSESNIGHMLFKAQNGNLAGMLCGPQLGNGKVNFGGSVTSIKSTKADAAAFLATPEAQEIKKVLLSLAYQ